EVSPPRGGQATDCHGLRRIDRSGAVRPSATLPATHCKVPRRHSCVVYMTRPVRSGTCVEPPAQRDPDRRVPHRERSLFLGAEGTSRPSILGKARAVRHTQRTRATPSAAVQRPKSARRTTRRRRRHATATDVKVARPPRPPLSGLMSSRRCVTSTAQTDQSSRSKLVLGGLKLNSCRSSSR